MNVIKEDEPFTIKSDAFLSSINKIAQSEVYNNGSISLEERQRIMAEEFLNKNFAQQKKESLKDSYIDVINFVGFSLAKKCF